ncbi:MAG: gliding motility-associated ABC transporter substrate-binding protein GldG [Prolixibacteraceae bacterium]|nr:gliding motility-associated ABC transporter substrate-binding protein GldG [Prolixibacteraceae bacterium]
MYSLLKKEISSFFGSLTGYVVLFVFLLTTGLFLWVFPGNYNIPESGYASLDGLFALAPWVYLFLVPAVTMRLFAEEKRMGTMEILLTRPISAFRIVVAKYLAGLLLVLFSLLPSFIYFYSVYVLGNPVGSIDTGGTWGAYIGLFFLAAIYVAIGVLASALTDNQIFAFILALALSFFAYLGFDLVGSMPMPSSMQQFISSLGINEHYNSVSRGVVDSRDLGYFGIAIFIFLWITARVIQFQHFNFRNEIKKVALVAMIILPVVYASGQWFFRIDLTAEKRYSITKVSKSVVERLEKPVNITLYLDGELPAGLRKLKTSIEEKIADYNAFSSEPIHLMVFDPYRITDKKSQQKFFEELVALGIQPTNSHQNTDRGSVTRMIFPGAVIEYGDQKIGVNLLKNNQEAHAEVNLNNSIESLEYEFTSAFANLLSGEKHRIAFLDGHGELNEHETHDFAESLNTKYEVSRITAPQLNGNASKFKVVVIANPTKAFPELDKFYLDQYLMEGGRLMWLVDPVSVSLDSLSNGLTTLAFPQNLNLDDQLFRYGVRLNSNLIQDVDCLMIPVNTAPEGAPASFKPAPWYFSPLLIPSDSHVIGRNMNRVKAEFVSSIDTVGKQQSVKKSVILSSSPYSLVSQTPLEVSLASINNPPDRRLFNQPSQPIGLLLEGTFTSVYKNRMVDSFGVTTSAVKNESQPTKMIVFADGNLMANQYRLVNGVPEYRELGFDRYSKQVFGNKAFLLNAINYLADDEGFMDLRARTFKIRLLDKVRLKEGKLTWQLINVILPLVIVSVFGAVYVYLRRRKYKS